MKIDPKWILAAGAAMLALGVSKGGIAMVDTGIFGRIFDWTRAEAFKACLPAVLQPYADLFINAGRAYSVDPFILAGICYRESNGGAVLRPPGPTGTGDFTPRTGSKWQAYANPATGMPNDGQGGWGRGLMQLDYGAENAWVVSHDWRDPQTSINRAAEIMAQRLAYFVSGPGNGVEVECYRITRGYGATQAWNVKYPGTYPPCTSKVNANGNLVTAPLRDPRPLSGVPLYEAAIASYNAGAAGVLQAVAMGLPAEAVTTGQEYVSWMASRIAAWNQNF